MDAQEAEIQINLTIQKCATCGLELVGENAMCLCDQSISLVSQPVKDPLLGTVLNGTYEIQEVVGNGGMGRVYRARDILMERTVAIKMLHAHLVKDPLSLDRFKQEARAASAINHPNVITVFDFGQLDTGQPYLIMDFLQGQNLSALIDEQGGLAEDRAINICVQACDALHVAHSKGVVHRDLKPSNIMIIQNRDGSDHVKIVDFGIAKLLPHSGKQAQNLTQTGELFGSPLYMSPEQFLGKKLDERTDIYAMGCVMYEAITGRPPFTGEHVLETMYKHLNEIPTKFAVAKPERKITPRFEAVVARALEKDPDQRFQSMSELRNELLLCIEGARDTRSLGARLQSIHSRLRRTSKRHLPLMKKIGYGLAVCAVVGLLVTGLVYLLQGDKDTQWIAIRKEAQEAYRHGDLKIAEKKFLEATKRAKEYYGDQDPKYTNTLQRLAWVYEELGEYHRARKIISKLYNFDAQQQLDFKAAQLLAAAALPKARELLKENVTEGPKALLKAGIKNLEKWIGPTDPGLLDLYTVLAQVFEVEKRHAEAEDARIKCVSIREESQGPESLGVADARVDLANLYLKWGKDVSKQKGAWGDAERTYAEAVDNYQTAIKLYKDLSGSKSEKIPATEALLAECTKLQAEAQAKAKSQPKKQNEELPAFQG